MTESRPQRFTRQDFFALLGALGAFVTIAAAAMYYFGWRRSEAQAQEMGMDVSLFGFSSQDYVLRSISSMYTPLLAACALVAGFVVLHAAVTRQMRSPWVRRSHDRVVTVLRTSAVALAAIAALSIAFLWADNQRWRSWPVPVISRSLDERRWMMPFTLVLATCGAAYLTWLLHQLAPPPDEPRSVWRTPVLAAAVAGTVILGCFWMLEDYAANVGRRNADLLAALVRTNGLPRRGGDEHLPAGDLRRRR